MDIISPFLTATKAILRWLRVEWHKHNVELLVYDSYSKNEATRILARAKLQAYEPEIYKLLDKGGS